MLPFIIFFSFLILATVLTVVLIATDVVSSIRQEKRKKLVHDLLVEEYEYEVSSIAKVSKVLDKAKKQGDMEAVKALDERINTLARVEVRNEQMKNAKVIIVNNSII